EQAVVGAGLVGVGVITALGDVKNARGQPAADKLGDQLESIAQLRSGIAGLVLHAAGDGADFVGADLGVERGAFNEVERRTFVSGRAVNRAIAAAGILARRAEV